MAPLIVAIAALAAFVFLALGDIKETSPTSDELPHLAAGYTYLKLHDYRLNDEHPPLIKELAALSILNQNIWHATPKMETAWASAGRSTS